MKLSLYNETLSITDNHGTVILSNIGTALTYKNAEQYETICNSGLWRLSENTAKCDNAKIEIQSAPKGVFIRSTFTNTTDHNIELMHRFKMFEGTWQHSFVRCIYNQFISENDNFANEMQGSVETAPVEPGQRYSSPDNITLKDDKNNILTFGFATFKEYFCEVGAEQEGKLSASHHMESHPLLPGESVVSDWLYIGVYEDAITALAEYADIVVDKMEVTLSDKGPVAGYCTWYYYYSKVTKDNIFENISVLENNRDKLPVKYIQLDDGWENRWGDWEPNGKFTDGMKALADEIKSHGYLPGIWVAPFGTDIESKIYKEHPDWLVKKWDSDESYGAAWKKHPLDYSVPEVREYISNLFHTIVDDWGFQYIKLDIIHGSIAPGRHRDPSFNALKNYREGLKVIREAVGKDIFLLGCTAPFSSGAGIVDGMRVSQDISGDWESIHSVFQKVSKRFNYNGKYFLNDADCLIIRKKENEDAECGCPCTRSDDEIQTFVTAMAASGGIVMLSDKLANLEPSQLEMLSKLFPQNTRSALPLDIMEYNYPRILDFGYRGKTRIAAFINWEDTIQHIGIDIDRSYVFEFWSQQYLGIHENRFELDVNPHCSKVLFFTEVSPVAVIGANDCICFENKYSFNNGILQSEFIKTDESVTIASEYALEAVNGCTVTLCSEGTVKIYNVSSVNGAKEFTVKTH